MNTKQTRLIILGVLAGLVSVPAVAQTTVQTTVPADQDEPTQQRTADKAQPRKSPRRPTPPPAKVTVMAGAAQAVPQVVTIVHRLSGVKMLRLFLRQAGERGTLSTIDPDAITSDAHASIIAGWTLDDGKTIAARLPQAAAEIELTQTFFGQADKRMEMAATMAGAASIAPRPEPDLTVITSDGRKLRVHYVGLDGLTGLSLLQISGATTQGKIGVVDVKVDVKIAEGQRVSIFAPERAEPGADALPGHIYVRVGEIDATVAKVVLAKSGRLERLMLRSARLSPVAVGGIAFDESGNTLGIIEEVNGTDARVVPAESVREAAQRLLEAQGSVPRPLLGVRGESIEVATRATFLANGWNEGQFSDLLKKQQSGILLTWVLPGSPAAIAKLEPGDVIFKVNQELVKGADEFSAFLTNAGPGGDVSFTLARPGATTPVFVSTKLGGSFEPQMEYRFDWPRLIAPRFPNGLGSVGMETMAITDRVATQLGARRSGLLVVTIKPGSLAARSGIREGDVIESIDNRAIGRGAWAISLDLQKKHQISIVRGKEKKQIVLEAVE